MKNKNFFITFCISTITVLLLQNSLIYIYGHGLSTDSSVPVDISGKSIVVETTLTPAFIEDPVDFSNTKFLLRIFDKLINQTISNIDYDIKIYSGPESLLNLCINSSNGFFVSHLVPDKELLQPIINTLTGDILNPGSCLIDTKPGDIFKIRSKVLSDGGLFHIIVILKKTSKGLQLDKDIKMDLFVSIGKNYFSDVINYDREKEKLIIKSYYDSIKSIEYNVENKTLSFFMPFNWDPIYIQQIPFLHLEFVIPKKLDLSKTNSYNGLIFDKNLPTRSMVVDDFTDPNSRIVHMVLNKDQLDQLSRQIYLKDIINNENNQTLTPFKIFPMEKPRFPLDILTTNEKYLFQISWNPPIITPLTPINFVMNLQDPTNGDLLRHSSFDFVITDENKIIHTEKLKSPFGGFAYQYTFNKSISKNPSITIDKINGGSERAVVNLFIQK